MLVSVKAYAAHVDMGLEPGVLRSAGQGFGNEYKAVIEADGWDLLFPEIPIKGIDVDRDDESWRYISLHTGEKTLPSFGVHDSIEAFLAEYKEALQADPRPLIVSFAVIKKDEEPASGGWRWHKWGPYIGHQNPQHEYIADEDDSITQMVTYSIHHMKEVG